MKKTITKLTLRKDVIAQLSKRQMGAAAGGSGDEPTHRGICVTEITQLCDSGQVKCGHAIAITVTAKLCPSAYPCYTINPCD